MELPLVSVIIPTFNRRQWIGVCLDSIKSQTYPRIETLVIDDGSTDGTVAWLESQPEYSFVRVHKQPKNGGASIARNDGIHIARGELIVFIDSDDALLPDHIETAVNTFREHPNTGLFCCDSTLIDANGEVLFGGRTWHQVQNQLRNQPLHAGVRSLITERSYADLTEAMVEEEARDAGLELVDSINLPGNNDFLDQVALRFHCKR